MRLPAWELHHSTVLRGPFHPPTAGVPDLPYLRSPTATPGLERWWVTRGQVSQRPSPHGAWQGVDCQESPPHPGVDIRPVGAEPPNATTLRPCPTWSV